MSREPSVADPPLELSRLLVRRRILLALVLAGLVLALYFAHLNDWLRDVERLQKTVDSQGPVAPLTAVLVSTFWVAVGLPRMPLAGLVGLLFGLPIGFCVAHSGVVLGNGVMYFFLRRFGGGGWLRGRLENQARRLRRMRQNHDLLDVLILRLLPVAAIVQNISLLALKPSPSAFWIGTGVGALPGTLLSVTLGAGFAEESWNESVILAISAVLLIGLSGWWIRRLAGRSDVPGRGHPRKRPGTLRNE